MIVPVLDPLVWIATLAASALGAREVAQEALRTVTEKIRTERRKENFWKKIFYLIGLPSTVLSASAGVTVVTSDFKALAAVLAFASAVLGGVFAFLRPDARMEAAHQRANQWEAQKLAITVLEKIDLDDDNLDRDEVLRRVGPILENQYRLLTGETRPAELVQRTSATTPIDRTGESHMAKGPE